MVGLCYCDIIQDIAGNIFYSYYILDGSNNKINLLTSPKKII